MGADVALRQRAVDRVGERVQRDVRVRMAAQRMVVGHAHAAEPHVIAGREGVNVEALTDARLARRAREPRFCGAQILHRGHLDVLRIALEHVCAGAPAHSATATSSVSSATPSAAARRCASRMSAKRNACGVCTARKPARGGVDARGLHRPPASPCR